MLFFQWMENKHFTSDLWLGKFNFRDDDISDMTQEFYAIMESTLQSSKFENLYLQDPFNLKIKILGHYHMEALREKQAKYLNKIKWLKVPNYGLENLFQPNQGNSQVLIRCLTKLFLKKL